MRRHDGRYYCIYSGGSYLGEGYHVAWASAPHPLGPWTEPAADRSRLLATVPGRVRGPGHNSVVTTHGRCRHAGLPRLERRRHPAADVYRPAALERRRPSYPWPELDRAASSRLGDPLLTQAPALTGTDTNQLAAEHAATIYRDGIVGLPGCFSIEWADQLHADFESVFADARKQTKGLIGRGPNRYYFAVHPERIRGFVDLVAHPAVAQLCAEMLGPDYLIIELGFDVPLPGATTQPWHRDFATPPETKQGVLTSLAFNLTTVDVTPDLAPFEIAPGTHFDDGSAFEHGMFPRTGGLRALRRPGQPALPSTRRRVGSYGPDAAPRDRAPWGPRPPGAHPRRGDRRHRPGRHRGPRPGGDPDLPRGPARRRARRTSAAPSWMSSSRSSSATTSRD